MSRVYATLLGVLLTLTVSLPAFSQTHTIRIENGQVLVDGTPQSADELPESLDLEGLSASLSFSGDTHFRLGDRAFFVEEGRLIEADPREDDFVVFVGRQSPNMFAFRARRGGQFDPAGNWVVSAENSPVKVYYEILDGQLEEMDKLHTEFDRTHSSGIALRLIEESSETAEMVKAFPRVELQGYLEDLQGRNAGLYDGIVREQLMEIETRRLASQIVSTANADRREALRSELADRLEEIFELKQANRRAEIEQLDARLRELRGMMDARQQRKAELIESRIQELLRGSH